MIGEISLLRVILFISIFSIFSFLEKIIPRRNQEKCTIRWINNLILLISGSIISRIMLPLAPIVIGLWVEEHNYGFLNLFQFSDIMNFLIGFIFLDLIIYFQHRIFHKVNIFWRIHKVHHSDIEIDASTALRFHPIEIGISLLVKSTAIIIIGANLITIIIFEVLLNSLSIFNHSNIFINKKHDKILRYLIVTPDMHRVHHSVKRDEIDKNFGFCLTWWDYFFRTYKIKPKDDHILMKLGLPNIRKENALSLKNLFLMPFRKKSEII